MRKEKILKDEKLESYTNIFLQFLRNPSKQLMQKDIKEILYSNDKNDSVKKFIQRAINQFANSFFLKRITETTDINGKKIKLKANQIKFQLNYDDDELQINIPPTEKGRINLAKLISTFVIADSNITMYDTVLSPIIASNVFRLQKDVFQTFNKLRLKYFVENNYSFSQLYELSLSKIQIDIKLKNHQSELFIQNTTLQKIIINEQGFDLYFENFISQNHKNFSDILFVKNSLPINSTEVDNLRTFFKQYSDEKIENFLFLMDLDLDLL